MAKNSNKKKTKAEVYGLFDEKEAEGGQIMEKNSNKKKANAEVNELREILCIMKFGMGAVCVILIIFDIILGKQSIANKRAIEALQEGTLAEEDTLAEEVKVTWTHEEYGELVKTLFRAEDWQNDLYYDENHYYRFYYDRDCEDVILKRDLTFLFPYRKLGWDSDERKVYVYIMSDGHPAYSRDAVDLTSVSSVE